MLLPFIHIIIFNFSSARKTICGLNQSATS